MLNLFKHSDKLYPKKYLERLSIFPLWHILTEIKMWKRKDSNGANYPDILIFIVSCNIIRDGQCSIFVMRSGEDNVTPFIQESGYGPQLGCKIYICGHAEWHESTWKSIMQMVNITIHRPVNTCEMDQNMHEISNYRHRGYLYISHYSHYVYIYTS